MGGEVPAILHEGEFVIKRSSAQRIGLPTLETLNRFGTLNPLTVNFPRFQGGGLVAGTHAGSSAAPGMGGEKTTVIVNNHTGQQANVEERRGVNGKELIVTIGQVIARDIRNNGPVFQSIEQSFGLGRSPIKRG